MGVRRRINRYKAPNLARRLKRKSKAKRKLNLMKNPSSDLWDKFKTLKANYKKIDIALKINETPKVLDNVPVKQVESQETNFAKIKEINQKSEQQATNPLQKVLISQSYVESRRKTKRKPKINRDEGMVMKKLIKKYKDDYRAMRRDIKLNIYQWTEKQCEFKHKMYLKRFGEDGNIDWNKVF